ncbi:12341_t:CDS:2 [Entrophospora sp. SA101]|nr:12341_t:CDS:2 [Entrophospora sp. SA101]
MAILIEDIRTIPGIKADNVEMWSLEENKGIKENEAGIEINQFEENKDIGSTNLEKKSKKDHNNSNNNMRIDLNLIGYISAPVKACIVLTFLGKNYDKITTEMLSWIIILSIVILISLLGTFKYALEMEGKNKWKRFLQRYKYNDQDDNHEQHKRNNYVWIFSNKKLSTSSTSSSQQPKQSKHSKPFAVFKKMQFHSSAVGQHATITNNCNDNDNGAVIEPFINLAEKAVYNFLVKNERIIPLETVKAFVAKQCSPISRDFCNADLLCMLNFILENINIFLKESVFHGHWSDHALQDVAILACEVIICFGRNYEEAFASKENVDNEIIKRWIDKASRKRKLDEMLIIMNVHVTNADIRQVLYICHKWKNKLKDCEIVIKEK